MNPDCKTERKKHSVKIKRRFSGRNKLFISSVISSVIKE